jgi:drug/metabolite transporter (DMT)-like permease
MVMAILLSLAASFCTATSTVCQRLGANSLAAVPRDGRETGVSDFDPMLVFRLARRPVWLLGIASMVVGFGFQVTALHYGPLALVQPLLAAELLFVFGYLSVLSRFRGVRAREWLAAVAMSAGLVVFLIAASPSRGEAHAPPVLWWISGLATFAVVAVSVAVANRGGSPVRRAALLGVATGVVWGFLAAVIKELSSHVDDGLDAVLGNWSAYVLIGVGAAAMLLASHAMTAGPLAASQPGFTLLVPVVAILLGVFMFDEQLQTSPAAVTAEVLGLIVLAAGVWALSRSDLITSQAEARTASARAERESPELLNRLRLEDELFTALAYKNAVLEGSPPRKPVRCGDRIWSGATSAIASQLARHGESIVSGLLGCTCWHSSRRRSAACGQACPGLDGDLGKLPGLAFQAPRYPGEFCAGHEPARQ